MMKTINKVLKMGIKIATLTKKEAEKEVKALVKANKITKKDGKMLFKKLMSEGNRERKRLKKLVEADAKKIAPLIAQGKKSSVSIFSKVSREAKKGMKGILKSKKNTKKARRR